MVGNGRKRTVSAADRQRQPDFTGTAPGDHQTKGLRLQAPGADADRVRMSHAGSWDGNLDRSPQLCRRLMPRSKFPSAHDSSGFKLFIRRGTDASASGAPPQQCWFPRILTESAIYGEAGRRGMIPRWQRLDRLAGCCCLVEAADSLARSTQRAAARRNRFLFRESFRFRRVA